MTVTLEQAKAELEALAERAASGEEVLISHTDGLSLRLVPEPSSAQQTLLDGIKPEAADTWLGGLAGPWSVPDDFDTMLKDEIEEMFYGNPDKFADVERYLADHPGHPLAALDICRASSAEPGSETSDHKSSQ